jgi:hypothetical protein
LLERQRLRAASSLLVRRRRVATLPCALIGQLLRCARAVGDNACPRTMTWRSP